MVIDDSDLGRTGFTPAEDDSPLVVDTYGVKASEFAFERLQSVARRNGEIIKRSGMIHLEKFSQRDTGNRGESTIGFLKEEFFGIFISERLDHEGEDNRHRCR